VRWSGGPVYDGGACGAARDGGACGAARGTTIKTLHEAQAQVLPVQCGIPWLGFIVYPDHRKVKARNAVHFTRRLEHNLDAYQTGTISFAELDASVQGWINHVRYADTWGLRGHLFENHPIRPPKAPS